jgi:hypothetical protein
MLILSALSAAAGNAHEETKNRVSREPAHRSSLEDSFIIAGKPDCTGRGLKVVWILSGALDSGP